jgi:hypothetical protein
MMHSLSLMVGASWQSPLSENSLGLPSTDALSFVFLLMLRCRDVQLQHSTYDA